MSVRLVRLKFRVCFSGVYLPPTSILSMHSLIGSCLCHLHQHLNIAVLNMDKIKEESIYWLWYITLQKFREANLEFLKNLHLQCFISRLAAWAQSLLLCQDDAQTCTFISFRVLEWLQLLLSIRKVVTSRSMSHAKELQLQV